LGAGTAIGGFSIGTQLRSAEGLRVGTTPSLHLASYVIFIDSSGVVNAIDGNSGTVVQSGGDAATIIGWAVSQLGGDGGLIFLRHRTGTVYSISKTITVPNNIFIVGEGNRPILQTALGGDFPIFTVTGQEVGFSNFQLEGNKTNPNPLQPFNTTSQKAFLVQPTSLVTGGYRFENLQINNFKNHGIHFLGVQGSSQGDVNVDHCNIYSNDQDGIRFETVYGFNVVNSFFQSNGNNGLAVIGCGEGYIANNDITFRNLVGILLYQALNVTIVGNEVNSNENNGILINNGTQFITIIGNTCCNNSCVNPYWNGIQISNGSESVMIVGNICRNASGNTSQWNGILVTDTCDGIIIVGNDLRGNASKGLNWASTGTWNSAGNLGYP